MTQLNKMRHFDLNLKKNLRTLNLMCWPEFLKYIKNKTILLLWPTIWDVGIFSKK